MHNCYAIFKSLKNPKKRSETYKLKQQKLFQTKSMRKQIFKTYKFNQKQHLSNKDWQLSEDRSKNLVVLISCLNLWFISQTYDWNHKKL